MQNRENDKSLYFIVSELDLQEKQMKINEIHNRLRNRVFQSEEQLISALKEYYKLILNDELKNAIYIREVNCDDDPEMHKIQKSIDKAKRDYPSVIEEHIETNFGYLPKWFVNAKIKRIMCLDKIKII